MPYQLALNGSNTPLQHVVIPALTIGAADFDIEFHGSIDHDASDGNNVLLGGTSNVAGDTIAFQRNSNQVRVRFGSAQIFMSCPIIVGEVAQFRIVRSGNELAVYKNGTQTGAASASNLGFVTQMHFIARVYVGGYAFTIRRLKIRVGGDERDYNAASTATGLTLYDAGAAGLHGSLTGFAGNDSQWLYYAGPVASHQFAGSLELLAAGGASVSRSRTATAELATYCKGGANFCRTAAHYAGVPLTLGQGADIQLVVVEVPQPRQFEYVAALSKSIGFDGLFSASRNLDAALLLEPSTAFSIARALTIEAGLLVSVNLTSVIALPGAVLVPARFSTYIEPDLVAYIGPQISGQFDTQLTAFIEN